MSAPRRSLQLEEAETRMQIEITLEDPTGTVPLVHFFATDDANLGVVGGELYLTCPALLLGRATGSQRTRFGCTLAALLDRGLDAEKLETLRGWAGRLQRGEVGSGVGSPIRALTLRMYAARLAVL